MDNTNFELKSEFLTKRLKGEKHNVTYQQRIHTFTSRYITILTQTTDTMNKYFIYSKCYKANINARLCKRFNHINVLNENYLQMKANDPAIIFLITLLMLER